MIPHSLPAWLYQTLRAHRGLCLGVTLLLWIAATLSAARLQPDMSSLAFFPDSQPETRRMVAALDLTPAARLLFVDLAAPTPDSGGALAQVADAVLQDLPSTLATPAIRATLPAPEQLLSLLPYVTDATALGHFEDASHKDAVRAAVAAARQNMAGLWGGGPALAWALADPLGFRQALLPRLPITVGNAQPDPLLGYPVSSDGRHLLLALRPAHSMHDVAADQKLAEALQETLQHHLTPGMTYTMAGGPLYGAVNAQAIDKDISRIVVVSFLGFVLVYALLVRSLGMFWLLLAPGFAASVALGGMGLLVPTISGLALGFGASVLGVSEDYAVHTHFALRNSRDPAAALGALGPPLLQGFLVNASGFAVLLLFSGLPAVRQLAGFALLTLGTGFILAITALPLCPGFSSPPLRRRHEHVPPKEPLLQRVLGCALALLTLCGGLFILVKVDVAPQRMGAETERLRAAAAELRARWGATAGHMLVVDGPDVESAIARARDVAARLRQEPSIREVSTITDLWPSPKEAHANRERWAAFTREYGPALRTALKDAAQEAGFRENAFAPFADLLQKPVPPFGPESLRSAGLGDLLDVFLHTPDSETAAVRLLLFTDKPPDLSPLPPGLAAHLLSLEPEAAQTALLNQFRKEARLPPLAWLLCLGLLLLFFRNPRRALLASLPPLCSIACILAWMVCTGRPLSLAGMAALPLVLGLAADHGIMVTHDLVSGVRLGVEQAVVVSSLTTLTGMGILALAGHPALRAMGEVIFWGLLVEVPAALWLLPRLCTATTEAGS